MITVAGRRQRRAAAAAADRQRGGDRRGGRAHRARLRALDAAHAAARKRGSGRMSATASAISSTSSTSRRRRLRGMIEASRAMKAAQARRPLPTRPLAGKTLAMIFDKPSTRTRVSFDVAMRQLGGDAIMLTGQEMQLGRGETIADTARVLSRYVDAIMIRTLDHETLAELARARHRAGDQRADPALASLPGDGRRHDLRGASRPDPRQDRGLDRATPTTCWPPGCTPPSASTSGCASRPRPSSRRRNGCTDWVKSSRRRDRGRHRPGGGGEGRRLRRHRHLGVDGRQGRRAPPQPAQALSGQCPADGEGQARRAVHALPAGAPRRGGHRRGDRRAAIGGVRRGGEPPARPEGHSGLVPAAPASALEARRAGSSNSRRRNAI